MFLSPLTFLSAAAETQRGVNQECFCQFLCVCLCLNVCSVSTTFHEPLDRFNETFRKSSLFVHLFIVFSQPYLMIIILNQSLETKANSKWPNPASFKNIEIQFGVAVCVGYDF